MPYHKVILNYIKKYVLSYIRGDKMLVETAQIMLQENVKYNDLFDRILVAQAIENDLTIVTTDENIPLYDVKTIW
jgi:PIN domain protein